MRHQHQQHQRDLQSMKCEEGIDTPTMGMSHNYGEDQGARRGVSSGMHYMQPPVNSYSSSFFGESPFSKFCQSNLGALEDHYISPPKVLEQGTKTPNMPQFPPMSPLPGKAQRDYAPSAVIIPEPLQPLVNSLVSRICSKLEVSSPLMTNEGDALTMHIKAPQYALNIDITISHDEPPMAQDGSKAANQGPKIAEEDESHAQQGQQAGGNAPGLAAIGNQENVPSSAGVGQNSNSRPFRGAIFKSPTSEQKSTYHQAVQGITKLRHEGSNSNGMMGSMRSEGKYTLRRRESQDDGEGDWIHNRFTASEPIDKKRLRKRVCCNCKKSRCLKLYCDCFANGELCRDCNCTGCANVEENKEEIFNTRASIMERNPQAFKPKVPTMIQEDEERPSLAVKHARGCNCKKTNCLKKYCECYQAGVKCGELCKCEGCKNCEGGRGHPGGNSGSNSIAGSNKGTALKSKVMRMYPRNLYGYEDESEGENEEDERANAASQGIHNSISTQVPLAGRGSSGVDAENGYGGMYRNDEEEVDYIRLSGHKKRFLDTKSNQKTITPLKETSENLSKIGTSYKTPSAHRADGSSRRSAGHHDHSAHVGTSPESRYLLRNTTKQQHMIASQSGSQHTQQG